jgi:uncharacterized protein (DUF302 family)
MTAVSPLPTDQSAYGFGRALPVDFDTAVQLTRAALSREGFGIVSEIDLARILREKLGAEIPAYLLLGACAPTVALQAVTVEPEIGLLLPCTIAIRQTAPGGPVRVSALDPVAVLGLTGRAELASLVREVRERLERVIARASADALAVVQLGGADAPEIC